MNWTFLQPAVAIEDWLPSMMKAEGETLNESIADLFAERSRVDALSEENRRAWQADRQHDRREFFRGVIACLEKELALRPRIEIFYLAKSRATDAARREVQDRLYQVESDIRQHCGLGPDDPLPPGACQSNASWHVARRALESVPSGIDTGDAIRNNRSAIGYCQSRLNHFHGALRSEEQTQRQLERERQTAAKRAAKEAERREEVVDEREAAIQRLLEPDRPRGRKAVAV